MQRRNPICRQRAVLDNDQTKDAMKVLAKYVKTRYRHSMLLSADVEEPTSPTDHTQSAYQFPRQFTGNERFSTACASTPGGAASDSFLPMSPTFTLHVEQSVKDEIKHKETETWGSYFFRILRFFYSYLGLRYLFLLLLIIGYALAGGFMFMKLEEEQQSIKLENKKRTASNKSRCAQKIYQVFLQRYENYNTFMVDDGWRWDFWNSVFYAGTVFTTIGYGNLTCTTKAGRIATILYGLVGIPLMLFVLKVIGEVGIVKAHTLWAVIQRKTRRTMKNFKKDYILKRTLTLESLSSDEILSLTGNDETESTESEDERNNQIPVMVALLIVFAFMVLCSLFVSLWENWDFLTAFYFFFVSLSTIGFGDVIPEHPRNACCLFALYFVGLALFSMIYAMLQERVENKYMWALELIDQEYRENQKLELVEDEPKDKPLTPMEKTMGPPKLNSQCSIRWRGRNNDSSENIPDRPTSERRFSVMLLPGEPPQAPPPVLGVFISHSVVKKKLLARSESVLSKSTLGSKCRVSSGEMISPVEDRTSTPWHAMSAEMNHPLGPTLLGPKNTGGSAPSLTGARTPSTLLSVITELSDEDSRHFKKGERRLMRSEATDESHVHATNNDAPNSDSPLQSGSVSPTSPSAWRERFSLATSSHFTKNRRHETKDAALLDRQSASPRNVGSSTRLDEVFQEEDENDDDSENGDPTKS